MNAYSTYVTAKACGWSVLRDFHTDTKNMQPEDIARRDDLPVAEVRRLRLSYNRIKSCAKLAESTQLPLDTLHLVSTMIGKIREDTQNVLVRMLNACVGLSYREAEVALEGIVKELAPKSARRNRINFAQKPDANDMVRLIGLWKSEHARAVQTLADKDIKPALHKDPEARYDNLLANWMIKKLLGDSKGSPAEPDVAYTPMIIMSSDPNVDVKRGHLNTLSGASIPLHEAINLRLANTGWVALTTRKNGRVHLETIVPITRSRFSTGMHRVGVILENLVCAHESCDLPALFCQAHHINSVRYHGGETSWENITAMCGPHNAQNDDNPNAPPRNGRAERGEDGWVGRRASPDRPMVYNPNPLYREGYRGTTEDIEANYCL